MRKRLGIGLAVLAGAAALLFVIYRWQTSGFSWQDFAGSLRDVSWSWLTAALFLILLTYFGRALRWEVMLRPVTPCPHLGRILSATCIGFTAVVLFGRAGEPVRPYLIARNEGVSFSSQIAVWVLERILDVLMILIIFGIALTQVAHSAIHPSSQVNAVLQAGGAVAGVTGLACLVLLIALRQFRGRVKDRLLEGLTFLPSHVQARVSTFLEAFEQGMASTRASSFTFPLIFYSLMEWVVIGGSFYCVFQAFPATSGFHFADIVIAMGFISFGSVVQIPGVGGGMQIVTVLLLTEFYGLTLETASSVALILWLVGFVVIVPVGLGLAFHEGIKWRTLRQISSETET